MRLVRWASGDGVGIGCLDAEGAVVPVAGSILDLAGRATRDPGWVAPAAGETLPLDGLALLAPVERPPSVRDFYAFEDHVATARAARGLPMPPSWYERPVFYFSNPAAIAGPGVFVARPTRSSALDYELELAWVVGTDVAGPDLAAAARAVVGYTVMNDWSARDVQGAEMAHSLGPAKGKDFATSLGPVLVTADEFDPSRGTMTAWVNGRLYSEADLSQCWWSVPEMTAFAAESTVVRAGDVFATGTCGTGCILELSLTQGSDLYPWLVPGDVVDLEIEGIGRLTNSVAAEPGGPVWAPDPGRIRPERDRGLAEVPMPPAVGRGAPTGSAD